jgi:hypothetical protein
MMGNGDDVTATATTKPAQLMEEVQHQQTTITTTFIRSTWYYRINRQTLDEYVL